MKINIEKTKKQISPKAIVDDMNKKIPRKNTNKIQSYGYQRPMGKLVSEKGPSLEKPKRSRKKPIEETSPKPVPLEMRSIDEQEDLDHTKKTVIKPYWKTPENIPVAEDHTESLDSMTLKNLIEYGNDEEDFLMQEFGTTNPHEIESITEERLRSGDYEQVKIKNTKGISGREFKSAPKINPDYGRVVDPSEYADVKDFDVFQEESRVEPEILQAEAARSDSYAEPHLTEEEIAAHDKKIHEYFKDRKPYKTVHVRGKEHDNLKTMHPPHREAHSSHRGVFDKIRDFFSDLKNEGESFVKELELDKDTDMRKNIRPHHNPAKQPDLGNQENKDDRRAA